MVSASKQLFSKGINGLPSSNSETVPLRSPLLGVVNRWRLLVSRTRPAGRRNPARGKTSNTHAGLYPRGRTNRPIWRAEAQTAAL